MKTVILQTATKYLLPLLLLFSIFILLRGHYLPGGGFVGGLVASIAFILYHLAFGREDSKELIGFHPGILIPIGLTLALLSGLVPFIWSEPFLTGLWYKEAVPVVGLIGTALFFDIGVYLGVIGVALTIIFTIAEDI